MKRRSFLATGGAALVLGPSLWLRRHHGARRVIRVETGDVHDIRIRLITATRPSWSSVLALTSGCNQTEYLGWSPGSILCCCYKGQWIADDQYGADIRFQPLLPKTDSRFFPQIDYQTRIGEPTEFISLQNLEPPDLWIPDGRSRKSLRSET